MKKLVILFVLLTVCVLPLLAQDACPSDPFVGRWALHLPGGAGWLEVKKCDGYLDADLLWYGGSVTPVSHVYVMDDVLVVTRVNRNVKAKDENGDPTRTHQVTNTLTCTLIGDQLVGKYVSPKWNGVGVNVTKFLGNKIPCLPEAPDLSKIKYGKKIKLFNGKDLTGWTLTDENAVNGFSAEDGALVNNPVQKEGEKHIHYGNLRTEAEFEDFNLTLKVNIPKGNNSGIYLRGIYEIQVFDSYGKDLDSHNMGALYSRITPSVAAEKPAGEWQDFDITLCDRHLTVILNGTTIIDNQPVMGVTGGALTACEFKPGPLYLQGDHGKVMYKDIVLKPIVKK